MWTRRDFLGASLAGAGAAIGPSVGALGGAAPGPTPAKPPLPPSATAVPSARAVLVRQLKARASEFDLRLLPTDPNGHEAFELEATGGRVVISGSSGVALCRGAYTYLRQSCNAMITWSGSHLDLPATFPDAQHQRVVCPYRFTQYLNPCTYGYTMAFWDWERWERELDWMALHGITMPLAMEGQELIWQRVWLSLGLTQAEIDQFSTGPAHLPWHRMGNINNLDGPLPQDLLEKKRELQVKILDRMRELGMKPVAPAFAGFVPQGFKRVFPDAETFTLLWLPEEFKTIPRSTRTFILHPRQNDLYRRIGMRFIQEYKAAYGEVEHYLADTFNELAVPVRADHRYEDLQQFGQTVFEGRARDPNGAVGVVGLGEIGGQIASTHQLDLRDKIF